MGGVGRRSTGGLTRSRMPDLYCTGQIIPRLNLVAPKSDYLISTILRG